MSTSNIGTLAYMTRPGELAYAQYDVPSPGPQAVMLKVLRSNVCGSELHIWNGKHPVKKRGGLGHEMVGTVAALGEGRLTDNGGLPLSVGDRVVATYFQTCESCPQCRGGQRNLCDNAYEFFGRQPEEAPHFHAAFGTHYYVHPRQHLYRVPESLPDAVAAGANCALSQVMFGLDQIDLRFGETLLVQGAGGLGLSAVAVAKARGCRVIVLDGVASRLEQALAFGAVQVLNIAEIISVEERIDAVKALTQGRGPDVALEVTGVPAAFSEGLQQLRRGGRYLVMGNLSPGSTVPFDPGYVTRKALTIKHVDRYDAPYLARALDFLEAHVTTFPFHTLVDAEYGLDAVEEALNDSAARRVTRAAITMTPHH